MRHRSHIPAGERAVRSRLAELVHGQKLLCASLVSMSRTCGKQGCKCTRGDPHVSLYLSTRVGRVRKMIYIPPSWERSVRSWVEAYREAQRLTEQLSQSCLDGFLKEKQRAGESKGGRGR
ncbi:MAG: hypothetical protein JRG73_19485 [Deltaproteobacteria bacterium]|nr:hypothetical protein [Deltaproteobacteria bacterium]MBW2309111.1 hypothetical protein [Deltaproteobacteria bacterium]